MRKKSVKQLQNIKSITLLQISFLKLQEKWYLTLKWLSLLHDVMSLTFLIYRITNSCGLKCCSHLLITTSTPLT